MTDCETARRIHEGDPDAIREFVDLHHQEIYRLLRHLTMHAEDAEDLTQQTFMKVRQYAGSFRGRASLRTWLHKIAIHEYTHWKRKQRKDPREADEATDERGYSACLDVIALQQGVARLPDRQREAFLLHEVHEMPIVEVAAVLGVPVGTAKSRAHHARLALRRFLQCGTEEYEHERRAVKPR